MITWCYDCSDWNNNQIILKHKGIKKIDFEMIKLWNNWILKYSTWNCSWMILCVYGWWFQYLQRYLELFTAHNFKSCWVKKFSKKNWSISNIIGLSHFGILTSLFLFCWSKLELELSSSLEASYHWHLWLCPWWSSLA